MYVSTCLLKLEIPLAIIGIRLPLQLDDVTSIHSYVDIGSRMQIKKYVHIIIHKYICIKDN